MDMGACLGQIPMSWVSPFELTERRCSPTQKSGLIANKPPSQTFDH